MWHGAFSAVLFLGAGRFDQRFRVLWPAGVAGAGAPSRIPPAGHTLGGAVMTGEPFAYPEALSKALDALRDLVDASLADARAATFAESTFALQMIQDAAEFDQENVGA